MQERKRKKERDRERERERERTKTTEMKTGKAVVWIQGNGKW